MTQREFRRFSWASEVRSAARDALFQDVLVECPDCGRPAWVRSLADSARLTCGPCGLFRETEEDRASSPVLNRDEARDPWFGARLQLQAEVAGHLLWAANPQHLEYIERYVSSRTRSRGEFTQFGSAIGEQLPGWMVSAKHRDPVLKAIIRMRAAAAG